MTGVHPEPANPNSRSPRFVVVTGLSGAGKSAAIRALEDLGYLCVDNLPTVLIPTLADLTLGDGATYDAVAVVVDVRDRSLLDQFSGVFQSLQARQNLGTWLIFLEASDGALLRRFSETRRPHPLAPTASVIEGILAERSRLRPIKKMADKVLDTSDLTVHELRSAFRELTQGDSKQTQLTTTLLSFGFKYGVPVEADLVLDVRFLPNPYFVPDLRPLTGKEPAVRDYVLASETAGPFLDKTTDLLRFLIPNYQDEGKSYLTVAIGCTGGRHRSVAIVNAIRPRVNGLAGIRWRTRHRDVAME
ncbi:MAG: RNase adapter RapZ [Acidobacteria bacterium]|nr:RNase adapter RapZ [Acidobacteriota bacterium]